jgi:Alpha-L-arabinofuranosidase B, catalytic
MFASLGKLAAVALGMALASVVGCGAKAASAPLPCDAAAAAGTPCVAAHGTARLLTQHYAGPLFQIQRTSDGATLNIYAGPSGAANIAPVDAFCPTTCKISLIYDQISSNHLPQADPAHQAPLANTALPNLTYVPAVATSAGQYYRNRSATVNIPTGNSDITEYMVVQQFLPSTCCGTYGDMEATVQDTGNGHMFALAYSSGALGTYGYGAPPWPGVDLENGVYLYGPQALQAVGSNTISIFGKYSTANWFVVKSADASQPSLTLLYSGGLPPGYAAHWEGGLSLGEGGDSTPAPIQFLEVMASTTAASTDLAIQASIAEFYGPRPLATDPVCYANNLVDYPTGIPLANGPWNSAGVIAEYAGAPSGNLDSAAQITGSSGSQFANMNEQINVQAGQVYTFTDTVKATSGAVVFPGFSIQTNDQANTEFAAVLDTNRGAIVAGTWGAGQSILSSSRAGSWWIASMTFFAPPGATTARIFIDPPTANAAGVRSNQSSTTLQATHYCPHLSIRPSGTPDAVSFTGRASGYPGIMLGSAPAMATFGGKLYVAFQADDPSHSLFVTSSTDGVHFNTPAQGYPGIQIGSAPAMAAFNNRLYVAFQANDPSNQLFVTSSADGVNFTTPASGYPGIRMGSSPAMTEFNSQLYIAFQANDPSHALFVTLSPDGFNFSTPATGYPGIQLGSAPAMTVLGNLLYISFQANDPGHALFVASSPDGVSFTTPATVYPQIQIGSAPAMGEFNQELFAAFQANDPSVILYVASGNPQ